MSHTLAAVFDNRSSAQQAMDELISTGFPRSGVSLQEAGAGASYAAGSDDGSFLSGIKHLFNSLFSRDDASVYAEAIQRGNCVLTLNARSEDEVERASDVIERYGPIDIDEHALQWRASGWTGAESSHRSARQSPASMSRQSDSGMQQGGSAQGSMQRADMGGQSISVLGDQYSFSTRASQRGGVRIYDTVTAADQMDPMDDNYYRNHWSSNFSDLGGSYDDYAPAYRYGSSMAGSTLYRDQPWDDVEPDLRRNWENTNPGSAWDKFRTAIRHGWEKMTR